MEGNGRSAALKRVLFWAPRGLAILFIAFISLFALDVFGEGYPWFEMLIALTMHLLPSILLVLVLLIAWRFERLGGILFLVSWLVFLFAFGRRDLGTILPLSLPLLLVGVLFWIDWKYRLGAQNPA